MQCKTLHRDRDTDARLHSNAPRLVEEFAKCVFVENVYEITKRWTLYPEKEDMDGYWNLKKLFKTIWCSEIDFVVDTLSVSFFKGARCTTTPLSSFSGKARACLEIMLNHRTAFFMVTTAGVATRLRCSKFMFNGIMELYADREDLIRCVVSRALFSSVEDNYLLMKTTIILALRSVATAGFRKMAKNGKSPNSKDTEKMVPLIKMIELLNAPYYKTLVSVKCKFSNCTSTEV